MEQLSFDSAPSVFTVTEVTAAIHRLLTRSFDDVRITGEISGYKVWTSGHAYFTLKDSGAQLRCVLFKNTLRYLRFKPNDGLAVVARGSIEVRQERGEYQLIVSSLEPQGLGALQLAFEQLKARLAAEGLFAAERKRPLPAFPRRIGIVTSPRGAVIRDMLTVLRRRFPGLHIRLFPTPVQGEGSIDGICEGLLYFAESGWPDVIIVGRGGGSIEDLWTFNEEAVARCIVECPMPVVSAVGHETDFTIADFVADLRAPTPSAAAELIVRNRADILTSLETTTHRVERAIHFRLSQAARRLHEQGIQHAASLLQRRIARLGQRLDDVDQRLRQHDPRTRLAAGRRRLDTAAHALDDRMRRRVLAVGQRLQNAAQPLPELMRRRLDSASLRLNPLSAQLQALSPLGVLDRGYAIVQTGSGQIVKSPADAPPGTGLAIRLRSGQLRATVDDRAAGSGELPPV
ncbi:exodeoxyribonuclease VII large subunit [Paludibaculum fermentans]|uniref:Exodeoxyribonuclease 7 large subunit n=1 Tax=Paludibaculum fermentans TaxID=1473598 RepID=A0A7S7NPE2_PALFE|nr:exodeoxyribonuclease VII large subunit [Paludibaculum fermentans]QOY86834.1 exodeoxyribonuclease VII large subunit [Paludibaculum fermentans]